jgi:adenine phosphoribosyltransferase
MEAAIALLQKVGADVRAAACIIELAFLNGRSKLSVPFVSVVSYDS